MNTKKLAALGAVLVQATVYALADPLGTAFTYQGQLIAGTNAANGVYDFRFTIYDAASGPNLVAGPLTNSLVGVTNGLFTSTLDFGPGVFTGNARWLEIWVRTNGVVGFTPLTPRQSLTPIPYALFAPSAGTANSAGSATAASSAVSLTGPLVGDVTGTQSATVVSSVGSQSAANVASGVSAANAATDANTSSRIVKRDASGNFSAGSVTLNGVLNLPATSASAGLINSAGNPLLHAYGTANLFVGVNAGNLGLTGPRNTGIGASALQNNTSGSDNAANGFAALYSNTSGATDTANGSRALFSNTSGFDNTANGAYALYSNTNGSYNTASGAGSLYANTSGSWNTANGRQALYLNTSGSNNTANGSMALFSNTTGSDNTANGKGALYSNTSGWGNTANGEWALQYNTNGYRNTANGGNTLVSNTSGIDNTANGFAALYSNTSGSDNTANGVLALVFNTSGGNNTANGLSALYYNTNGNNNTAIGVGALQYNGNGNNNIGLGVSAGNYPTNGNYNIDIGNMGLGGDSQIIRIGTQGTQTNTFIAGISGTTVTGGAPVYVDASGQLGTVSGSSAALLNANQTFTGSNYFSQAVGLGGDLRLNDHTLWLRPGSDQNHGLSWYLSSSFAGVNPDGPVLFGYGGGGLGTLNGGQKLALTWNNAGDVVVDPGDANTGALLPGLTFGKTSGEGISSKRTSGTGQWGLDFYTGSTKRMTIARDGNVGIGASSPGRKLVVQGDDGDSSLDARQVVIQGDTDANQQLELGYKTSGNYGSIQAIQQSTGLKPLVLQPLGGAVGIGRTPSSNKLEVEGDASKTTAGGWSANSDARIKHDIHTVSGALEKLAQVRLVSFRYTDEYREQHPTIEDRPYLNVVAQEFQAVFPESVKPSGDELPDGSKILGVDTYPLTIYSAAAVQELNQKLTKELKRRDTENAELKARLERLEQLINAKSGGGK